MMIYFIVFLLSISVVIAGYSDSSSNSNKVGDGYGYGYSGSFSGGDGGQGFPGGNFPPFPQFDFNNFLQSYFDSLRKYHEQFANNAISYSHTVADNSKAQAKSSLIFQGNGVQQGQQSGFAGYGFPGGFPAFAGFQGQGPEGGSFAGQFGGGEGAAATAAIGPEGIHQTAGVFPENPNSPNVNTRFGAAPPQGGGGFHSVSTSSFSGSSNVDGRPSSFHQASTTVNDNGKVTTYTVKKP